MTIAVLVVPCFDEEARLDRARFLELAAAPTVKLLFVDDGSRDNTLGVLESLRTALPSKIDVLALGTNRGKGEAVRHGMNAALAGGASVVGYADADLATPPAELLRLLERLERHKVSVVVGSRVLLIGRRIERRNKRHVMGRVFATIAAGILRVPFYDTQCGAKLFKDTELLRAALATPFASRWAFDVELLGRLLVGTRAVAPLPESEFLEVPLREWVDVGESKLKFGGMARTLLDLVRIEAELLKLRRERR